MWLERTMRNEAKVRERARQRTYGLEAIVQQVKGEATRGFWANCKMSTLVAMLRLNWRGHW